MTLRLALAVAVVLLCGGAALADQGGPARAHAELDPLPFARGGYGVQLGFRPAGTGLRVALASFALDVPDAAVTLGGNEGWSARVRPSGALYVLYYPSAGSDGWAFGGALRYLRLRYTHVDEPDDRADVSELSPEAIVGYKWHPWARRFYLQPWFGLGATVHREGDLELGAHEYDPLPVQLFATVNLGWELSF